MVNEGWYHDPFQVHQLRWFSAGTPTDLVRDEDVEAYEAPPQDSWDGELTPFLPAPTVDELGGGDLLRTGQVAAASDDLVRAGDTESDEPYDPNVAADAALDAGAASGISFS